MRLEQRMGRQAAVALHRVLVDQFIASHRKPPRKLILDFDATDDPVHGNQELGVSFMVTTTATVSCPCMSSVASSCW